MHSSGMRTVRLLTVSMHALHKGGGVYPSMHWAEGGVSQHALGRRGCLPRGLYLPGWMYLHRAVYLSRGSTSPGGCTCPGVYLPWGVSQHAMGQTPAPRGQTNTCENIIFPNFLFGLLQSYFILERSELC